MSTGFLKNRYTSFKKNEKKSSEWNRMYINAKFCIFFHMTAGGEPNTIKNYQYFFFERANSVDTMRCFMYIIITMLRSVHVKAPAKLNLHLKVCDVRPDGFHDIESIFQKIPIYDELLIEMVDSDCTCQVISPDFILPFENTLTSAYKAFCSCTGIKGGVRITLTKRIPSGAGMGGGSSDAAAVLSGLSELFGVKLTEEQKYNAAAKIGSDVFFFLGDGEACDAAVVSGRGENVRYIVPRRDLSFVLLCPGVHSATAEAYYLVDSWHNMNRAELTPFEELEYIYRRPIEQWSFYNSFTEPLAWKFPEIKRALSDLRKCNAGYVQMTGSGSVVFGVFASDEDANKSYEILRNSWDKCYYLASR